MLSVGSAGYFKFSHLVGIGGGKIISGSEINNIEQWSRHLRISDCPRLEGYPSIEKPDGEHHAS